MTDSVSGFLSPEERAAMEMRRRNRLEVDLDAIERTVLQFLAEHGQTSLPDLIERISERPRSILSVVDRLEQEGIVEVSVQGVQEFAKLTGQGRMKADDL